jgi:NAD(P)H-hydrate epimerase
MLPVLHRTSANRPLVITPHVGEFDRMFGFSGHHFDRLQKAKEMAAFYHITILLKGAYTRVVTPDGEVYFNSTGNHGMAKAGSGDVLAGLIGGLLAQEYSALHACILGAWLHGKAGDIASEKLTKDAMAALDLVHCLPHAWQQCQTM